MKRAWALTLAASFLVGACATSGTSATPGSATPTADAPASVSPSAAPTPARLPDPSTTSELTVWHYQTGDQRLKGLDELAKLFNETYPNVTVNWVFVPFDQMTSKLLASAATKDGPDVVNFQAGDRVAVVEAGALSPLTTSFEAWPEKDEISPAVVHRVGEDIYAIQGYANLIGLWYNKDILDKYGIVPPTTPEELEAALATVTAGGDKGLSIDGKPGIDGWWTGMPWFYGQGVDITMSDPIVANIFARLEQWVDKGYISREAATWNQDDTFNKFLAGDYAFAVAGNWYSGTAAETATFTYGAVPYPTGPEGPGTYLGGDGLAIGAFTEQADLGWAFLEHTFFSRDGQGILLENTGNIPTRADTADLPVISESAVLPAFVASTANSKALPVEPNEIKAQELMGNAWSAVISGQKTAAEVAVELPPAIAAALAGN